MSSRVSKPGSTNTAAKKNNSAGCSLASCACQQKSLDRGISVGQEVGLKDIIDKTESDFRRYTLYMFMLKLFGLKMYKK